MSDATPAAVVVAWQAGPRAAACLDRLAEVAPGCARILVDNESRADALAVLVDGRAGIEVVALADNHGFAGGANAGLERAFEQGASHALLLNDDVLLEPGCLEALIAGAGDDAVAAPFIDAPGADAFTGGSIDWRRGYGSHRAGARDYLVAAALCVPVGVWRRVGPFDERLFLYYEDVDWSVRATAAGVELRVIADARAQHEAGASSGGGQGAVWGYYSTRNRLWFLEHHRGRAAARREAVRTGARAVGSLVLGRSRPVARAKLEGLRDWRRGRMGRGSYPR